MISSTATEPAESRPRFRERQVVTAAELSREQGYLVGMRRRHLVGAHSWGIVSGLALAGLPDGFAVQPGVAVDGFGRELVVKQPLLIRPADVGQLDGSTDVWLLYGRVAATPPVRGRYDCGPGRHSRWREQPCVRLTEAREPLEPRGPPGVTRTSLEYEPSAPPPDGNVPAWPVYLGRVTPPKPGESAHPGPRAYHVDLSRRPYAGLVGESVRNPRGSEGLRLGGDEGGVAMQLRDAAGTLTEPLSVDASGDTTVRDDTGLSGELTITGPVAEAGGLSFSPLAAPPEAASPWRAYRAVVTEDGRTLNQLRIEVGHPGDKGDPLRYALGIGSVDAGGAFDRYLTLMSNCTVVVSGDVAVEGLVSYGPLAADPDDPRFRSAVLLRWARGITQASASLDQAYAAELALSGLSLTADSATRNVTVAATLTNPGAVTVSTVTVAVVCVGDSNDPVVRGWLLTPPTDLEAGDSVEMSDSFDLSTTNATTVTVTVAATGLGPAGNPLSESVEDDVSFTPIIN